MAARTLYVSRPLLNGAEVRRWARAAGFASTLPADDMHVTIAFSRAPVDWARLEPDRAPLTIALAAKGPQRIKRLGKAVVLRFTAPALTARWRAFRQAGASWDYPEYQPHVTLTYQPPEALRVERITPFAGTLRFGPERFKEVNTDWADKVREAPLTLRAKPILLVRRAS